MLERDLRALTPQEILLELRSLSLGININILEEDRISDLNNYDEIVIAEDEIGEELRTKYFSNNNIITDTTFLRWNRVKAFSQLPPQEDAVISTKEFDKEMMTFARTEAHKSSDWWRQVGSAVVKDGVILLRGHNAHLPFEQSPNIDGDPRSNFDAGTHMDLFTALHGEAGIIAEAARIGMSLEGAVMYVTTFPCPNCAMLISKSGIKKVYYCDGYSLLNSTEILKIAGIKLIRVKE